MWIDFSDGKEIADKSSPFPKSENKIIGDTLLSNTDVRNGTYIIQPNRSLACLANTLDENDKSTKIINTTFDADSSSPKSMAMLEDDIENQNSQRDICNTNYAADISSCSGRRRSSSFFMETLRKLVCMHERYTKYIRIYQK